MDSPTRSLGPRRGPNGRVDSHQSGPNPSPPPKRRRLEFEYRTPSTPISRLQITWKIEDFQQLLCPKTTDTGGQRIRDGKVIKLHFYDSAHAPEPRHEVEVDAATSKTVLKVLVRIVVAKNGNIGCQFSNEGEDDFKYRNLKFEVVLPDGSIRKRVRDPHSCSKWELQYSSIINNFAPDFLSRNLDLTTCGLNHIGDGGLILRVSADIMKEGWVPYQPCPSQDHNIEQEDAAIGGEEVLASLPLSRVISSMWKNSEFSDVSIVCQDGQAFKCHKAVLSAWSTVFRAMFTHSGMIEGQTQTVSIQDIKPRAMKALLMYMYDGQIQCEPEDQLELLAAAEKYNIQSVKNQCLKGLIDKLQYSSADNVLDVLAFTDLHTDLKCLRFAAVQALAGQKDEIMGSEGWNLLCKTSPQAAFKLLDEARQFEKHDSSQIKCGCWK